jgi:5'-3' exonuclease
LVEDNKLTKGRSYYYQSRFNFDPEKPENAKKLEAVILKYIEGLEFYVTYYYLGCQSWNWFYPYHYAPLLTDVYEYIYNKKVKEVKLKDKGQPLDPFMALMIMVPQHSFGLLPSAIR